MDFKIFKVMARSVYERIDNPIFSVNEVLDIFEYYFSKYERVFGKSHPPIKTEQIKHIIENMPYVDDEYGRNEWFEPEHYEPMIDKYFQTKFKRCDYNINHFFAGSIRLLRFYEELY